MSLTLVTNPVTGSSEVFAGFLPIEFIFKREDQAVNTISSGVDSKAKINYTGDISSDVVAGDYIYLYSEGTNITYDGTFEVITSVAGEITVDTPYIEGGTGGYINYLKNYYVEMQLIHADFDNYNLLPFSLEADGDAAGNITIDVSVINDQNRQNESIAKQHLSECHQEFEVKYREVYDGSSNSFTVVNNKLLIVLYATETPEVDTILNSFDLPKIYLGYPAAIVIAHKAGSASNLEVTYDELNMNNEVIDSGDLGQLSNELNGFLMWKWDEDAEVNANTKYIEFDYAYEATYDYDDDGYDSTDYVTN